MYIYPQNTDPVMKRLNKTSDLHPFNVQYTLIQETLQTPHILYVKYFFPNEEKRQRNKWCKKQQYTATDLHI